MSKILDLIRDPEFWFVAVFCQVIVGLLTNWISKNASLRWLDIGLYANALLIVLFSVRLNNWQGVGSDWVLNVGVAIVYVMFAILGSPALKVFTLLATNSVMVIFSVLLAERGGFTWEGFVAVYSLVAVMFGIPELVWLGIVTNGREQLDEHKE